MRRIVIVDYGKQDQKVNPKFYPLIWIALIFATLFINVYAMTTTYSTGELKGAVLITQLLVDVLVNGLLPCVFVYVVAALFYRSLARRGLLQIPRKDFIYITMAVIAVARMIEGVIAIFAFVEPMLDLYIMLWIDLVAYAVALYLEFFLILKPKYLNPVQAKAHFSLLSKYYLIWSGILFVGMSLACLTVPSTIDMALEEGIPIFVLGEELSPMEALVFRDIFVTHVAPVSYATIALYVGQMVVHFVLDAVVKKEAKKYLETHKDAEETSFGGGFYANGTNYYTGRPYDTENHFYNEGNQNPFNNGGNPYGNGGNPFAENNDNPFAERNPFGEDFDDSSDNNKNDDNPFGDF